MKKVALITGSSRGIGAATAIAFAKDGYDVSINYNNSPAAAENVKKACEEAGADVVVCKCDVSVYEECRDWVQTTLDKFGRIDVLVNNAGIGGDKTFLDTSVEESKRFFEVNCFASIHFDHLIIPKFIEQGEGGVIVSVTSVGGLMGFPGYAEYSGSKAAVHGRCKAIAREMAQYGIRYNCLAPGMIQTDMVMKDATPESIDACLAQVPIGRFIQPEEIADGVLWLVHNQAITGQIISVNGGLYI